MVFMIGSLPIPKIFSDRFLYNALPGSIDDERFFGGEPLVCVAPLVLLLSRTMLASRYLG
jgi:hypothetical protein